MSSPDTESAGTCPNCGAPLRPEQEWCLECGAAARTRIVSPPGWKTPIAIVAVIVLLAGAGLAFAVSQLASDPETIVSSIPATAAPTTAAPPPPPATETTTAPPQTTAAGEVASWPQGTRAWTVILLSTTDEAGARAKAAELARATSGIGLLNSSDFPSLKPGFWVVFTGQYDSREKAQEAATAAQAGAPGAYARLVEPKPAAGQ